MQCIFLQNILHFFGVYKLLATFTLRKTKGLFVNLVALRFFMLLATVKKMFTVMRKFITRTFDIAVIAALVMLLFTCNISCSTSKKFTQKNTTDSLVFSVKDSVNISKTNFSDSSITERKSNVEITIEFDTIARNDLYFDSKDSVYNPEKIKQRVNKVETFFSFFDNIIKTTQPIKSIKLNIDSFNKAFRNIKIHGSDSTRNKDSLISVVNKKQNIVNVVKQSFWQRTIVKVCIVLLFILLLIVTFLLIKKYLWKKILNKFPEV